MFSVRNKGALPGKVWRSSGLCATPAKKPSRRSTGQNCGGEMYPVLLSDPQQVDVERYKEPLKALIRDLEREQGYFPQDAFLVLKDILGKLWTDGQPAASNP